MKMSRAACEKSSLGCHGERGAEGSAHGATKLPQEKPEAKSADPEFCILYLGASFGSCV